MKNQQFDKILAVVVLYGEELWFCNTYKSLLSKHPRLSLFIYDNSPSGQHIDFNFDENIQYISDPTNPGLSFAYNQAALYADKHGYDWLLILDQDTSFPKNILNDYINAMNENPEVKLFVAPMQIDGGKYISPVKVFFHTAKCSKSVPVGITSIHKYSPINSGMMINLNAFFKVGGYNEKVPLDFSDYQFVERFARFYDSFYVLSSVCQQAFSNQVHSTEQKLFRFNIFCDCLKSCEKKGMIDEIMYFYVVLKRAISLTVQLSSLKPLLILLKYFK